VADSREQDNDSSGSISEISWRLGRILGSSEGLCLFGNHYTFPFVRISRLNFGCSC